jgi:hypothetical protein
MSELSHNINHIGKSVSFDLNESRERVNLNESVEPELKKVPSVSDMMRIPSFSETVNKVPLRILILGKLKSGKTVAATSIASHFDHVMMFDETLVSKYVDTCEKPLQRTCILCDQTLTSKTHSNIITKLLSRTDGALESGRTRLAKPTESSKTQDSLNIGPKIGIRDDMTLMESLNISLIVVSEYRNIVQMDWDYILMTHIDIKDNVQLAYGVVGNKCGSLKDFREKLEEHTSALWSLCIYDVKHNKFSSITFPKPKI